MRSIFRGCWKMQSFCRLRRQTALLVRSMKHREDESPELRRQPVHGSGAAPVTPRNFIEAYRGGERGKSSLAHLGFAIVTVDGRGTPMRNRVFRDAGYPEFTQVGIDDHIAAIRELAGRHPEMDLKRVGIYGWS